MKRLFALALTLMLIMGCACADVLTLPADTTSVAARAFYDTNVTYVVLPAGLALENIGEEAFPSGTCISGTQEGLYDWAAENGYSYWNRTRRALIIGQTYEGTGINPLPACANDAKGVAAMLQGNCAIPYKITSLKNLTKVGILNAIKTAFAGAGEGDVSLFYYSGHGMEDTGDLVPTDLYTIRSTLTLRELRRALEQVPGTKIVILDSCFSGNMVLEVGGEMRSRGEPLTMAQLASRQASAFATDWTPRDGGMPEFIVITACSSDEPSYCDPVDGHFFTAGTAISYFTYALCEGTGFDPRARAWLDGMPADTDADGEITQREILTHVMKTQVYTPLAASEWTRLESMQAVQAYPTGGTGFVLWGAP